MATPRDSSFLLVYCLFQQGYWIPVKLCHDPAECAPYAANLKCADKVFGRRTLGQGEMIAEATAPPFTGLHHFAVTVRDIEASAAWYQKVFQANPADGTLPHYGH
jgi:hypothetical protein